MVIYLSGPIQNNKLQKLQIPHDIPQIGKESLHRTYHCKVNAHSIVVLVSK